MTAVTAHSANEGSFGNATDFTDIGMIMNDSGVYDENNNNNFDLAVRANLSGVDKLRFLTDFYKPSGVLHMTYCNTDQVFGRWTNEPRLLVFATNSYCQTGRRAFYFGSSLVN